MSELRNNTANVKIVKSEFFSKSACNTIYIFLPLRQTALSMSPPADQAESSRNINVWEGSSAKPETYE